jgi:oligopeptide transport system permease protein
MSSATAPVVDESQLVDGTSLWKDAWRRLRKNRMAVAGGTFVVLLAIAAFLGPFLTGYGFEEQNLDYGARRPSLGHWMGTDYLGRDLLTRVFYGSQVSLLVGLMAAVVSLVIGTLYGAVSGYRGGRTDDVMMRVVDVLYTVPYVFLVILLVTAFGQSIVLLFVALGAVQWLSTARIVRGQVLSLKEKEFVQAARAVGTGPAGIILRHLIPNTLGPIVVYFSLTVPQVILQEAFLSYLGLGVQAPRPSLGALINQGALHMDVYPWELVGPAIVMAALLFSLNFLGDGLRDALDPQMKK